MNIRNWKRFQHFKNRRPPWIKLYREILDDLQWHELPGEAAKTLVSLWLIASEGDEGQLPDLKTLSFRLRVPEKKLKDTISMLSHWIEQRDINAISTGHQNGLSETETETETESAFESLWERYPAKGKDGKKAALRSFRATVKTPEDLAAIGKALENYLSCDRVQRGYVKNGSTWFNNWRDWINPVMAAGQVDISEAL